MKAIKALELLKEGNQRFVEHKLENITKGILDCDHLVDGQTPFAAIVGCSDSRVPTEMIFDTGLGDLFIIRNAGSVANKTQIASIEFAVLKLKVELVVVLVHQNCGAVQAAIEYEYVSENLDFMLSQIRELIHETEDKSFENITKLNAFKSIDNLINKSKIIKAKVAEGSVKIVPAYYEISSGKVYFL
ncbi:MAG: carbonic anhydrase [Flavobacteriaceae bacterium]|nr:carbonic anhydrase [Flavobacteriaceae bacterium]